MLKYLTPQEKEEIDKLLIEGTGLWVPLPGPQEEAYLCEADVLFYGGAAGGGKTDLAIGLALTQHDRSIIYRREGTQLQGIIDRMQEILKTRDGYNGQDRIWRVKDKQIEFGSCPHLGDEQKYQGRPHDLKVFDEITHFMEYQFRFLCGWKRSVNPNIRQRVLCTGNPPTDSDGDWILKYWAAWLDPNHPNPAKPGELRWYAMDTGVEVEVDAFHPGAESRSFIPSKVTDNPYLMATGYQRTLMALPEPLRSQMLSGSFQAGKEDNPFQIIPSKWVDIAMARWSEEGRRRVMSSMGVDVARGGKDKTCISRRHGVWFDEIKPYPGEFTPDGQTVAGLVVGLRKDGAPVHVDVIGVGASVYDHLDGNGIQSVAVSAAESPQFKDLTGKLSFMNRRAELYWHMRELLDPANNFQPSLPVDSELKADLCSVRWKLTHGNKIQAESKDELKKRIGRSPDKADAAVMANIVTDKIIPFDEREVWRPVEGRNTVTGY